MKCKILSSRLASELEDLLNNWMAENPVAIQSITYRTNRIDAAPGNGTTCYSVCLFYTEIGSPGVLHPTHRP